MVCFNFNFIECLNICTRLVYETTFLATNQTTITKKKNDFHLFYLGAFTEETNSRHEQRRERVPPRAIQEISHLLDDMMVVEQPQMVDEVDSEQEDNYEADGFVEMDDDYKEHMAMQQEIIEFKKKKKPNTNQSSTQRMEYDGPDKMDSGLQNNNTMKS